MFFKGTIQQLGEKHIYLYLMSVENGNLKKKWKSSLYFFSGKSGKLAPKVGEYWCCAPWLPKCAKNFQACQNDDNLIHKN